MKGKLLLIKLLCCLLSFSQSGEIDTTFGIDGKVVTGFGTNNNTANATAFQTDGKFIVGGTYVSNRGDNDFALARYNSDGTLDTTFGSEGKVNTNFGNNNYNYINSIYVVPDGKIMVIGTSGMVSLAPKLVVVRYLTNGTIDASFGTSGKVISTLIPYSPYGNKLVFQPDGKFLITSCKQYNSDPNYYFGIERYSPDGVLDITFGTDGQAVSSFGNGQSIPASLALQPDGKILVAGRYQPTNARQLALMRFTAEGSIDTSFDGDGKVVTNFGNGSVSEAIEVSVNSNGKISVTGIIHTTPRNFGLVQYNSNGSLDTSFDGDGKATIAFQSNFETINSVTRQSDGKFLVVIKSDDFALTTSDFIVRRYNSDISLDTSFGVNGQTSAAFTTGMNESQAAGIASDGKIVVVGKAAASEFANTDFAIARYDANGILDTSLHSDGKITSAFEKGNDQLSHVLMLPDDAFITVGTSGYRLSNNSTFKDIVLSKFIADGTLDSSFGILGKVVSVFGQNNNAITAAALQPDGKIVLGNTYYNLSLGNSFLYELIRYHANGSLDTSFGINGKVSLTIESTAITIQADGKIVVGATGTPNTANAGYNIFKFNENGTIDTSFDTVGAATITFGNNYYGKMAVLLQSDGKIIVTGSASNPDVFNDTPAFVAARLNSNGSLDTTFGINGKVVGLINDNCFAYAGFLQSDGKILTAGISFGPGGVYFSSLRYTENGILDTTYGTNGTTSTNLSFDYRIINHVLLQPDGKFLVALSLYNQPLNTYDFRIRRFNPDSTYDNEFGGPVGVTTSFFNGYDEAFAIGLQSDHKIIVGGTTSNGITNDFAITRYTNLVLDTPNFNSYTDLILYPNPVTNTLHIKVANANEFEILECRIFNLLGQLMFATSDASTEIETSTFSNGIYSLQVTTSHGIINKKFIKE